MLSRRKHRKSLRSCTGKKRIVKPTLRRLSLGFEPDSRLTIGAVARDGRGEWRLCGYWHAVKTTPQWIRRLPDDDTLRATGFYDVRHHLTLFLARSPARELSAKFAVLLTTDSAVRARLDDLVEGLGIRRVRREDLEQAFLRGASRQAWLHAVHRPTSVKPDAKGLAGLDLRQAIDPFGDQSFRLEAAVSDPSTLRTISDFRASLPSDSRLRKLDPGDALGRPPKGFNRGLVGLSLRSGLVWTRATDNIDDLVRELDALCTQVEHVRSEMPSGAGYDQRGYDVLARPQQATSLESLGDACDFSFELSTQIDAEGQEIPTEVTEAEQEWLDGGTFEVLRSDKERLQVDARLRGEQIATLRIQPLLHTDGRAELVITADRAPGLASDHKGWQDLDYLLQRFQNRAAVWFSNGYTIQEQRLFNLKYRDVPFDRWRWLAFNDEPRVATYAVAVEKPAKSGLWDVPWTGNSLFEFVVNNITQLFTPTGAWYLICDDGSGEIADFVFLEPSAKRLRLIHVKAAEETKERGIAPAMYEVVISQATKNLRFLDPKVLAERLQEQKGASRVEELTWQTGGQRLENREQPILALESMGHYLDRGVIVLQPHTRRSSWRTAGQKLRDGELGNRDRIQFLRLRTLLADLEDVCRRFDASFECWGENDGDNDPADGVVFPRSQLR